MTKKIPMLILLVMFFFGTEEAPCLAPPSSNSQFLPHYIQDYLFASNSQDRRTLGTNLLRLQYIFQHRKDAITTILIINDRTALGELIITMPLLAAGLLNTFSSLSQLTIVSPYPAIVDNLDGNGRVRGISDKDFRSLSEKKDYDLVLSFGEIPEGFNSDKAFGQLGLVLDDLHVTGLDSAELAEERFRRFFSALGLPLPAKVNSPRFKRATFPENTFFINPHGRMNKQLFPELLPAWTALIESTIRGGTPVRLNTGERFDSRDANALQDSLSEEIRKSSSFTHEPFQNLSDLVDFLAGVKGVVTIDTAIFHLARRFNIPTVVITTDHSRGWIPQNPAKGEFFGSISYQQFKKDPRSALLLLDALLLREYEFLQEEAASTIYQSL